ncbi:MAG: LysR family transcriptional regulator [Candidatus Sericytochromatia bacterium]
MIDENIISKIFEKYGETLEAERLCTFYRLLIKNGFYKTKKDFPNYENFRFLIDNLMELGLELDNNDLEEKEAVLTKTFNFDWLRYFLAFAESNNTSKAAKNLSVTPQAIVKGISNIENFYKIKLLNRNKHFTELTTEGKIFKEKAEKILNTFTDLESLFKEDSSNNEEFTIVYNNDWELNFINKVIDYLSVSSNLKVNLFKIDDHENIFNYDIIPDLIFSYEKLSFLSKNYEYFNFKKSKSIIVFNKELLRKKMYNKFLFGTTLKKNKSYIENVEKLYVPEKYLKNAMYINDFNSIIRLCENGYGYAFLPTITITEQLKNKTLEIAEEMPISYNIFYYLIIKKDINKNIRKNILSIFDAFNNEIY